MGLTTTGAIYGVTTYGGEYYGATPTTGAYRWAVEVDWDGDGVFDGTNEASRLTYIQCNRGRKSWLQPNGQGFYPISVGVCHLTLDNHDRRYDAWNTSSPLYPNVIPGVDVRVRMVDGETETTYAVFYGIISDIVPSGYGANRIVKITVEDGLRYLRNNYSFSLSTGAAGMTVKEIIETSLTDCGWRWGQNLIPLGVVPYYISDNSKSVLDNVNKIVEDFDTFGSGVALFTTSSGDLKNYGEEIGSIGDISNIFLKDMSVNLPFSQKKNIVKYYWSTYGSTSPTLLTYPGSTVSLTSGNTFLYNNTWVQSSTVSSFASNIYNLLIQEFPRLTIRIQNRPAYQFSWDLFDFFNMQIDALGISNSFQVGGIEHYGEPQSVSTIYYLEPNSY